MREIKFRAWDKEKKQFIDNREYGLTSLGDVLMPSSKDGLQVDIFTDIDYELMQFTGLKDKNGVEIYEGDILKPQSPILLKKKNYEVSWEEFGFFISELKQYTPINHIIKEEGLEIIGNIYENPELLK